MSRETWQYARRLEYRLDFWYNLLHLLVTNKFKYQRRLSSRLAIVMFRGTPCISKIVFYSFVNGNKSSIISDIECWEGMKMMQRGKGVWDERRDGFCQGRNYVLTPLRYCRRFMYCTCYCTGYWDCNVHLQLRKKSRWRILILKVRLKYYYFDLPIFSTRIKCIF